MNIWPFKKSETQPKQLDLSQLIVEPFNNAKHTVNSFDCGKIALNKFLSSKAKRCHARAEFCVFIARLEGSPEIVGFYALQVGSDKIPETRKHKKSYVGDYSSFPAINLTYLAVHNTYQGQKIGRYLLQDVFVKVAQLSNLVGFYALTVQSIDASTSDFYSKLGFEEYSEGTQPKLLYTLQDILKLMKA